MAVIRPAPIESLEAYKHISSDSGYPTVIHPVYNPKVKAHIPPDPPHKEFKVSKDRGSYADPQRRALSAVAKSADMTESIGILPSKSTMAFFFSPMLNMVPSRDGAKKRSTERVE